MVHYVSRGSYFNSHTALWPQEFLGNAEHLGTAENINGCIISVKLSTSAFAYTCMGRCSGEMTNPTMREKTTGWQPAHVSGHYSDVIMSATAPQITGIWIVYSTFVPTQIKEGIKAPRHWPLWGNSPVTGEFPSQSASNAENASISWRHHENPFL